jgi:hypothetical protein
MSSQLLLGTSIHPATGDARRRQARAAARLRELSPRPPVNLQFADRANLQEVDGFETMPILRLDSNIVTGRPGVRKPVVKEMCTRLAELAVQRGARYFGFSNSDIIFTPSAVDRMLSGGHRACLFARSDFEPGTERDLGPLIYGTDALAVEAEWWLANQRRFRAYVVGESGWDNVYTAQLLCWAGGMLFNREPLVLHEAHPTVWEQSSFAEYNGYLTALDRLYFTRWVTYVHRLEALRARAQGLAALDDELRLQDEVFRGWKPSVADRGLQTLRVAKLEVRRWW